MNAKMKETILNPILKGNPITVLVLGICSSLAVTVELKGALVMAISVTLVTGLSSLVCSLLRKTIPNRVRIIIQLVVVALMVILVDQLLKSFEATYPLDKQLSVYIGLIITRLSPSATSPSLRCSTVWPTASATASSSSSWHSSASSSAPAPSSGCPCSPLSVIPTTDL